MQNKRIYLSSPTMHEEEINFINEAFERNWVAPLGFNCDGFEEEIISYLGGEENLHSLAVTSGTSALHLAVKLAGIKKDDVVLCSDMTFVASVNPVIYEKGIPVFVDSEEDTWNMSPEALEAALKKYPQAKAVILVHLYGIPAKIDEIKALCRKYNVVLIEDSAEALSSEYKGRCCGTFGDYSVLSFNGNKIITTSGGGMLITKDKQSRDKALFWATQAREKALWYQHEEIGYNYRMSNIVAGIGRGQLMHLDEHKELKNKIYFRYKDGFKDLPVTMNPYADCSSPNFWLSCMLIDKESDVKMTDIIEKLAAENVEARPIWKPMHMQPVFKDNDFVSVCETPIDEIIFERGLCLPSDIKMTEEDMDKVIEIVRRCFE